MSTGQHPGKVGKVWKLSIVSQSARPFSQGRIFPKSGPKIQGFRDTFPKVREINFPKVDTRFPMVEKSFSIRFLEAPFTADADSVALDVALPNSQSSPHDFPKVVSVGTTVSQALKVPNDIFLRSERVPKVPISPLDFQRRNDAFRFRRGASPWIG